MIEISTLTKVYGQTVGVEDLSFEIEDAEIFALLGPNGAGKTTTLRLMAGLIGATNGYVKIDGTRAEGIENLKKIHSVIGVLPESPGLYENLTAYRNLQFYGRMYGLSDPEIDRRASTLLEDFELEKQKGDKVATFSKGMKQKLAIIRTVIHDPEYVFLDEPLSGLDPEASKFVKDYMRSMKKDGKTVILSTHDLNDADKLSDRVAVVKNRLLAVDTPNNLKQKSFKRAVVFHLSDLAGLNLDELNAMKHVNAARINNNALVVEVESPEENNPDITNYLVSKGFRVQFIGEIRRSLEDVYLSIVEKSREGKI